MRQPRLMDEWGTEFFGRAKSELGNLWYYEERQADGTLKKIPLMPMESATQREN